MSGEMAAKKVKSAIKEKQLTEQEQKELSEKHERLFFRIGEAIENGTIRTFDGLLDFIAPTPLAKALVGQSKQLEAKMKDPRKFNMGDALTLAELTGASREKTVLLFLYHAMGLNKDNFKKLHKNNPSTNPSS